MSNTITTLPTLYSRTSTGAIQQWDIVVSNDKFRTISGQVDGQLVTSEWTVCKGKNTGKTNETTADQQALKEAQAKWDKKAKEGYFEKVEDIDKETVFWPMLAKNYEDYKDEINWGEGVFCSPKLDGLRCIVNKNGMFTRNGKKFVSAPHIIKSLEDIFQKYPKLVLDGELYCDRLSNDFNKIISLAKKTKPTADDLEESQKYLKLHIFDIPVFNAEFERRWPLIRTFYLDNLKQLNYFELVDHIHTYSEARVEKLLSEFLQEGYEGLMINLPDGKYENKRTKSLLKFKKFHDKEFKIVDIVEGEGNRSGMFGRAVLLNDDGSTFESNARGSQEFYREILRDKNKYIGTLATVRYQNLTPDGVPRFPVIVEFDRQF